MNENLENNYFESMWSSDDRIREYYNEVAHPQLETLMVMGFYGHGLCLCGRLN